MEMKKRTLVDRIRCFFGHHRYADANLKLWRDPTRNVFEIYNRCVYCRKIYHVTIPVRIIIKEGMI